MFSVVIPVYNKAPYLAKAIQSVKDQTFSDWELILVDDGSSDSSVDVINAFLVNSSNKIFFITQPNQGVSIARNNGVRSARYEYIAFLDADDWWEERFLEEMYNLILTYPDASLYGCSYYRVKNALLHNVNLGLDKGFISGYIDYFKVYASTLCVPINCSFVIVRRESFNFVGGFLPTIKFGEDFHLWVKLSIKYKVAYLNKKLAYSNQDVDLGSRALGKLFIPESHILWNLSNWEHEENSNMDLKQLFDKLRVYGLLPYYLTKKYNSFAKEELSKVNWINQPLVDRFKYNIPLSLLILHLRFMQYGSKVKYKILNLKKIIRNF